MDVEMIFTRMSTIKQNVIVDRTFSGNVSDNYFVFASFEDDGPLS